MAMTWCVRKLHGSKKKRKKAKLSNNFNQWVHSCTQITLIPEGMRQMKRPAQKLPEL